MKRGPRGPGGVRDPHLEIAGRKSAFAATRVFHFSTPVFSAPTHSLPLYLMSNAATVVMQSAVFGVDLGSNTCKLGRCSKGGVDVILNASSNRLTPCVAADVKMHPPCPPAPQNLP